MKAYLDIEETERLEAAATCMRDRLLIRLLSHLGCRISEALALTVDDIDLRKGTVTIQHLKLRIKAACPKCGARLSRTHTFCHGCGAKVEQVVAKEKEYRRVRTLPLDDDTLKLLKKYIKRGGFTPHAQRAGYAKYADYSGYAMYAGYEDFPKL